MITIWQQKNKYRKSKCEIRKSRIMTTSTDINSLKLWVSRWCHNRLCEIIAKVHVKPFCFTVRKLFASSLKSVLPFKIKNTFLLVYTMRSSLLLFLVWIHMDGCMIYWSFINVLSVMVGVHLTLSWLHLRRFLWCFLIEKYFDLSVIRRSWLSGKRAWC